MIALAAKTGLLLCSFLGYILFLYKKGVEIAFAPVLVSAGIGLAMFAAGLLNVMPQLVPIILFGGWLCLGFMAFAVFKKELTLSKHAWLVLSVFLVILGFMALRLRSMLILEIDNFTHWLTVVKDMMRHDRLPNFDSFMISFKGYPTGTAGFIYYVAKILGDSEGVFLFAQSILYISCLMCLWAFVQNRNLLSALFILPASIFLLMNNNPLNSLCVDTMLALLGISGFTVLVYYKDDLPKATLFNCLLSSFLMIVKNSGLFFVIVHSVLILVLYIRSTENPTALSRLKSICKLLFFNLILPLLLFYIWNRHVDYAYIDGGSASHSMNLERYASTLSHKKSDIAMAILSAFWRWLFNINASKQIILFLFAVYFLSYFVKRFIKKEDASVDSIFLKYSVFSYVAYILGLLGMYFVSMGDSEAVYLAAIERYFKTNVIYLVGIGVVYILLDLEKKDSISYLRRILASILIIFSLSTMWEKIPSLFYDTIDYNQTVRHNFRDILDSYGMTDGTGCYILYTEEACGEAVGYMRFVSRYELWSWGNVYVDDSASFPQDEEARTAIINKHDYLVVMYESEEVNQFIRSFGFTPGQRAYHLTPLRES